MSERMQEPETRRAAARGRAAERGRRGIRTGLLAAVLAAAFALTACQAVPGSGPVQEGLQDLNQGEQPVQFNPGGPTKNANQEQIVRGFIGAALSSVNDYQVAREFLTPDYAGTWDPDDGVYVDEGTQSYKQASERVGELSVSGLATVDRSGVLTPLQPGPAATTMRFEFEQVDGQWRISSAPNGVIIDHSRFSAVRTKVQLYFLTPDNRLVAEPRWYLTGSTLSTQVLGGLLAGPSEVDAKAMRTAFPSGTTLSSNAVPVNGGTARIELWPDLLTANAATRDLVRQQIAASLQSVPGVTDFEVSVNGSVVDSDSVLVPDNHTRNTENLVTTVLRKGKLGELSGGEVEPLPGVGSRIARLHPNAVALAADRESAAVRHADSDGSAVSWVSEKDIVKLDLRKGVYEPSLDRFGYVWSYASSEPRRILVQQPGSELSWLKMPDLAGRLPLAVRVSPGGNRIAMLMKEDSDTTVVLVAAIVRDEDSRPTAIVNATVEQLITLGQPVDLDWVDETRLVALSRLETGVKVTVGPLGDLPIDAGSVANAIAVSGGGSRTLIRVLDRSGRLYAPQGSGWQWQSDEVKLIVRTG